MEIGPARMDELARQLSRMLGDYELRGLLRGADLVADSDYHRRVLRVALVHEVPDAERNGEERIRLSMEVVTDPSILDSPALVRELLVVLVRSWFDHEAREALWLDGRPVDEPHPERQRGRT